MPVVSSYHYLFGPIVAVAALGLIVLMCRWVFSVDHRVDRTERKIAELADYGLLVTVATTRTRDDADMLREVLRGAGVRASVTPDGDAHAVLVFSQDADRARTLV